MNEDIMIVAPDGAYIKITYEISEDIKFLRNYLETHNLTFPDYDKSKKDLISIYLAGMSYLVMFSDKSNCFLYVGDKVSKEQRKTLRKNKELFKDRLIEVKSLDYERENSINGEKVGVIEYHHLGSNYKGLKKLLKSKNNDVDIDTVKVKRKCKNV